MSSFSSVRTRRINHFLHSASRTIIDLLVTEDIGTLIIGKNENWKQEIHIGKRNNQNVVQVPHAHFINMLTYKAKLVGVHVILTEESYTSKCSFLDHEDIKKHEVYAGKRVKRGLFRSGCGTFMNADVNGSLNIIRKVAPKSFEGVEDCVVNPVRLSLRRTKLSRYSNLVS